MISGALTELMGIGNVWLSANIRFNKPIYVGDHLTAELEIQSVDRRGVAEISVKISNERGEALITGSVESMRFPG